MSATLVRAAGGLLWRGEPRAPEVALVHRPRYDDWSLPKGKLDAGEHPVAAAVREVAEETGAAVVMGRRLGDQRYRHRAGPDGRLVDKHVEFFAMRPAGGDFQPGDEVDELAWLPVEAARTRLSYDRDRDILDRFAALPADLIPVLAVRHARAGRRGSWPGDDRDRPLDADGERQALLVRDIVAFFGPAEVRSAPLLRCEQTVRPLAARLGVDVVADDAFADAAYSRWPDATLTHLRELASGGRGVALCSQGETVPGLVRALAAADEVAVGEIRARKGSLWALFFTGDRLADAFYLSDLRPPD